MNLSSRGFVAIDNLDSFTNITHLDLSNNRIAVLENLDSLTGLTFFTIANNRISSLCDITWMKSLLLFDISNNQISVADFSLLPSRLSIVFFSGNPCSELPSYRFDR